MFHHGDRADRGHYTCAVRKGSDWFLLDDQNVARIPAAAVIAERPDRQAHLLFYQAPTVG